MSLPTLYKKFNLLRECAIRCYINKREKKRWLYTYSEGESFPTITLLALDANVTLFLFS
jgi:hypothetical protein